MGFHGSRLVFHRKVLSVCLFVTFLFIPSRLVFHGTRSVFMVFHGFRWVFMVFHGCRLVSMVPVEFSYFFWFQVGFSWFKAEVSENSRSREFSTRVSFIFSRSTTRNDFLKILSRNMRVAICNLVLLSKYENGHMIISISSRQARARKIILNLVSKNCTFSRE